MSSTPLADAFYATFSCASGTGNHLVNPGDVKCRMCGVDLRTLQLNGRVSELERRVAALEAKGWTEADIEP